MRLLAISSNSVYELPKGESQRKHLIVTIAGLSSGEKAACLPG